MTALQTIQLRDGRFVMLPAIRLQAARNSVGGLLRQRALWLVACLHLLADDQRHELGGSTATISQTDLAAFTGLSPASLRKITRALLVEDAIEVTRPLGPTGPQPTVYRLVGDPSGPRVFVTHAALRAMREHVAPGVLAGAFATYITIAELANEERADTVTASRQVLARLIGVSSARSVDQYVGALRRAKLLRKHAICSTTGQQPVTWELVEPGDTPRTEHRRAASPGAIGVDTPCSTNRDLVQNGAEPPAADDGTPCILGPGPGADCQDPASGSAAPIARTGEVRQDLQRQDGFNSPVVGNDVTPGVGEQNKSEIENLCEHLAASLARRATPSILGRPGGWLNAPAAWREHARHVLEEIDIGRARRAVDYLEGDAILGSQIRSMQAFDDRLDEVLLRLSAAEKRANSSSPHAGDGETAPPAWAEAKQHITAAIRAHGTNRAEALPGLRQLHWAYEPFIAAVGWTNLCREDPARRQWDWQQAWKQACSRRPDIPTNQEAA